MPRISFFYGIAITMYFYDHEPPHFHAQYAEHHGARIRVDDDLGTVVWPNGADLDPLVLHGDFEPAARFVHR